MPELTTIHKLLVLIPALPLAAAVLTALLGPRLLRSRSHWPTILALAGSLLASVALLQEVRRETKAAGEGIGWETVTPELWRWVTVADARTTAVASHDLEVGIVLRADPLTAIMLVMVTFVATLVAVYSVGYMHDDRGYWRFFSYVSLFVFSMTMLVSVSNFVLLYVFWEAVGLCSYLLIGFWYQKPEAAAAGQKAFLVNRVGDFGFALAIFLIWTTYGTLNFHDAGDAAGVLGAVRLSGGAYVGGTIGLAICLLLMLGACGKSAQLPLHVWLPDAMEGPTPVSALIHAATMVTAGVYMVTRCTPLFLVDPRAQMTVACIGGLTALVAGIIAFTQTDLKRVLAYSTISQLGYMFLALGTGSLAGIVAGMFHLFTHAFFKALLFLGAGSVMHAMGGVIDVRRFGGLRRLLPVTHVTFLIGCLALAGVPPLAGFFSKDGILAALHEKQSAWIGYEVLYYGALFTALLTAMYTFRAYFLTFWGAEEIPPEAGSHAHESPPSMTGPLVILAICAAGAGLLMTRFAGLLEQTPSLAYGPLLAQAAPHDAGHAAHDVHRQIAVVSSLLALGGIALAAFLYLGDRREVDVLTRLLRPLYRLSLGKFFFDPIYRLLIVWPLLGLAWLSAWIDGAVVDRLVNLCGRLPLVVGRRLRSLQRGLVHFYAMLMVVGLLVLIAVLCW